MSAIKIKVSSLFRRSRKANYYQNPELVALFRAFWMDGYRCPFDGGRQGKRRNENFEDFFNAMSGKIK